MYIYLVSSGSYSDYGVEFLAVNEVRFSEGEMLALVEEVKEGYRGKHLTNRTEDRKLEEELIAILRKNKFQIIYPVGEFHYDGYLDSLDSSVPWMPRDREPDAFRIRLA